MTKIRATHSDHVIDRRKSRKSSRMYFTSEVVFACYTKACAPPPTGKGGSSKTGRSGSSAPGEVLRTGLTSPKFRVADHDGRVKSFQSYPAAVKHGNAIKASVPDSTVARHQAYVKDMLAARKTTTVTRDGNIAVTNGGGKMPRFRMRQNKSSAWLADRKSTASSAARIREILK